MTYEHAVPPSISFGVCCKDVCCFCKNVWLKKIYCFENKINLIGQRYLLMMQKF